MYPIEDDQQLVLELLREQHLLLVQGSGFNWPEPDHLRIVTLPHVDDLRDAIGRLAVFLEKAAAEPSGRIVDLRAGRCDPYGTLRACESTTCPTPQRVAVFERPPSAFRTRWG